MFVTGYCQLVSTADSIPEAGAVRRACSKRGYVAPPPSRVITTDRVQRLREQMTRENSVLDTPLDAYLITSDDEHQVRSHTYFKAYPHCL